MTAVLRPPTDPAISPPTTEGGGIRGLLAGEWRKFWSLRSNWLTLGIALLAMALLGLLFAGTANSGAAGTPPGADGGPFGSASDPVGLSLGGYQLVQLAIGVIGIMLITGEYASGTIRTTFAAVPRRWPVVAAKAAVLSGVVLVSSGVSTVLTFLLGQSAYGEGGASLTDDGVARVLFGTALYLTAIGLLGMALAWLIRSTAAAVSALFGVVFLLPILAQLLPDSWGADVTRWLPSEAGSQLLELTSSSDSFGPWAGFAVLCGYLVIAFGIAVTLLRRRDA